MLKGEEHFETENEGDLEILTNPPATAEEMGVEFSTEIGRGRKSQESGR